jgi:hypothetical protein
MKDGRAGFAWRIFSGLLVTAPFVLLALVVPPMFRARSLSLLVVTHVNRYAIMLLVMETIAIGCFLSVLHRGRGFTQTDKKEWTFLLLTFMPFAAVVFWYRFIWSADRHNGSGH